MSSTKNDLLETPQPSLRGRNAWVLRELVEARQTSAAEAAAWIIDRWIDGSGRKELAEHYEIDVGEFYKSYKRSNVVSIDRRKK